MNVLINFKPVAKSIVLISLAIGVLFNACEAKSSGGKSAGKSSTKTGTYHLPPTPTKNEYIGKSVDIPRRLGEHTKSGKLNANDRSKVITQPYNVNDKVLRGVEKTKIRTFDVLTNGKLANNHHAPLSRENAKPFKGY